MEEIIFEKLFNVFFFVRCLFVCFHGNVTSILELRRFPSLSPSWSSGLWHSLLTFNCLAFSGRFLPEIASATYYDMLVKFYLAYSLITVGQTSAFSAPSKSCKRCSNGTLLKAGSASSRGTCVSSSKYIQSPVIVNVVLPNRGRYIVFLSSVGGAGELLSLQIPC